MRKLILLLIFASFQARGQKPQVRFLQDSVEVGCEVELSLSYLHSKSSDLIFPDSTFDFSPFEFVSSRFFETKKVGEQNLDSVIYSLVTYQIKDSFEISTYLSELSNNEKIYSDTAKIYFKSQLAEDVADASVLTSESTFKIKREYNMQRLFYILIGTFLLAFIGFVTLKDWFKKQYLIFTYYKKHKKFISQFREYSYDTDDVSSIHDALTIWKNYIEYLTEMPVSTMSTSEIGELYQNESLESALKIFDRAIFGKSIDEKINMAFHSLRDFAIKRYRYELRLK